MEHEGAHVRLHVSCNDNAGSKKRYMNSAINLGWMRRVIEPFTTERASG
jgi:hypothetical protein